MKKKGKGIKSSYFLKLLSSLLILLGALILVLTFWPPLFQEVRYRLHQWQGLKFELASDRTSESQIQQTDQKTRIIEPIDKEFGIVIPKIGASARIFPNIDPYNEKAFLPILRKGVAQAKGTGFPGEGKNIYLFAHSTDAFFNVGNYNAVFYLIGKLTKGDEIDIYYQGELFQYAVTEKMVVLPNAVQYLELGNEEILTLQTCYPPGTTLKRLIVRARKI